MSLQDLESESWKYAQNVLPLGQVANAHYKIVNAIIKLKKEMKEPPNAGTDDTPGWRIWFDNLISEFGQNKLKDPNYDA